MSRRRHTSEFEDCIRRVMAKGKDKASAYAICTAAFQKAGKPIWEKTRILATNPIKEKIVEHHLDDASIITGYISDEELIIAYHVSDVLLYPAEQGTFGTPIIEAMASGLNIIAVDIPPMNELLSKTEQLLYPPKDYNAMVENIVKVLSEEQNANKIYELQKRALENYNYPIVGRKLLRLYKSLIS